MVWNWISAFLSKRRARLRKEQLRRERGKAEYAVLSGYEDQIQERTMRKLAEMLQLPADELVAAAASRGEMAVVAELERRYPEDEVARTWGPLRLRSISGLAADRFDLCSPNRFCDEYSSTSSFFLEATAGRLKCETLTIAEGDHGLGGALIDGREKTIAITTEPKSIRTAFVSAFLTTEIGSFQTISARAIESDE
jgi:hypothetical protein